MSILNKLKKLNTEKYTQLFERHPLAREDLELRLQYLAAIALAVAVDRVPTVTERHSFLGLATSLSVDGQNAEEQLAERANISEDDIGVLFDAIRRKKSVWIYILDLIWLHASDGVLDDNEIATMSQLCELLEISSKEVRRLQDFILTLKLRKLQDLFRQLPAVACEPHISSHLPELLKPCFSYAGMLQDRWIDHGNGAVTDSQTGLMWMRHKVGESAKWIDAAKIIISGTPISLFFDDKPTQNHVIEIIEAIREFNCQENLGPFSNWRLPSRGELMGITSRPATTSDETFNRVWFNTLQACLPQAWKIQKPSHFDGRVFATLVGAKNRANLLCQESPSTTISLSPDTVVRFKCSGEQQWETSFALLLCRSWSHASMREAA